MMRKVSFAVLFFIMAVALFAQVQSSGSHTSTKQPPKTQPSSATASAAPQPETALKWLQAKYRTDGAVQARVRAAITNREMQWSVKDPDMAYSGCTVTLNSKERWFGNGSQSWDEVTRTFSLQDLSADIAVGQTGFGSDAPIEPLPWAVTLATKDGEKKMRIERSGEATVAVNRLRIYFGGSETADRAANALRDAILACGGSKEAY